MKTVMLTLCMCSMTACALDDVEDVTATDEQAIIGGTTDTGDPCVVAVFAHPPGVNSGSLCTGSVIGSHTVLTAAHCVDPRVVGAGQVFEILSGTTLTLPGIVASSTTFDPAWNPNNLGAGHDIGIVHTSGVLPFPLCAIGPLQNVPTRLVGYGSNTHANTGAGTKRMVTTVLDAANALLAQFGNSNMQTCHGDSGGPAFQVFGGREVIVGTTSFGQDQSPTSVCFGGGVDDRTDAFAAFINANTF
jgi:secreted trypsin-like serine protease